MASHKSVVHVQRGFRMSKSYAEQVMRDHCTITWISRDELTIRDTTDEERLALRAQQAQQTRLHDLTQGILSPQQEVHGLMFERPKSTKYKAPRRAYEEMEAPLCVRVCRWPRKAHQFAAKAA